MQAEGNRADTEEENRALDEEIDAIDRELERIRGNLDSEKPVQRFPSHPDIKSAIGLHTNKEHNQNKPVFLTPKQVELTCWIKGL